MTKNVLLIEDDRQMKEFIIDYLNDYSFNCKAFETAKELLKELIKGVIE